MAAPRNNISSRSHTTAPSWPARITGRALLFMRSRPKTGIALAVSTLAAITAAAVIVAWPNDSGRYEPPITARQYSAYTACLLTDSQGIAGASAKPVWTAMQAASTATTAQISFLALQSDATTADADAYINTLAARKCDLIVTVGSLPDQAARDRASAYPKQHFAAVGSTGTLPPNATAVHAAAVQDILESSFQTWKQSS